MVRKKGGMEGLKSIAMVEPTREIKDEISIERRYYLTSLINVEDFSRAAHNYWHVENKLHWLLDVTFREDVLRIRQGHAAENFSTIRRIALNLLKQEKNSKRGVESKPLKAG